MDEKISPPSTQSSDNDGMSSQTRIGIGVGVLVGGALLILVLYLLLTHSAMTETVRDLFIIVLALESLAIGTLLVVLVYQLIVLIRVLREDIKPIVESTNETVNTVKGTATFVSQRVTKPAITASSYASGIGRSVSVLLQMLPRQRRSMPTPSSDEETASEPTDAPQEEEIRNE